MYVDRAEYCTRHKEISPSGLFLVHRNAKRYNLDKLFDDSQYRWRVDEDGFTKWLKICERLGLLIDGRVCLKKYLKLIQLDKHPFSEFFNEITPMPIRLDVRPSDQEQLFHVYSRRKRMYPDETCYFLIKVTGDEFCFGELELPAGTSINEITERPCNIG